MMLQEYERVLVATDGSEGADAAIHKAVAIAKRNHAELFILHVIDTRPVQATSAPDIKYMEAMRKIGDDIIAEAMDYAESQGLRDVTSLIEVGTPKLLIATEIPNREDIDLIVMGAKGMGALERFFVGSVSENVVRYSKHDVLIVRKEDV